MSLITDALGLRQRRAGKKITRSEQLPPFRPPRPQRAIVGVLGVLLVLGGLAYWRGAEGYDWLERAVLGLPARAKKIPKEVSVAAEVEVPAPKTLPETDPQAVGRETIPAGDAEKKEKVSPLPGVEKSGEEQARKKNEEEKPAAAVPAVDQGKVPGEEGIQPGSAGLLGAEDMGSINVSLAPTKEEQEKIRKAKEEERVREVREYLRRAVIQGVSEDGEDSRVLMDGQLVGLGEKTPLLDLVLEKVEPGQILFRDEDGKMYPKSY